MESHTTNIDPNNVIIQTFKPLLLLQRLQTSGPGLQKCYLSTHFAPSALAQSGAQELFNGLLMAGEGSQSTVTKTYSSVHIVTGIEPLVVTW